MGEGGRRSNESHSTRRPAANSGGACGGSGVSIAPWAPVRQQCGPAAASPPVPGGRCKNGARARWADRAEAELKPAELKPAGQRRNPTWLRKLSSPMHLPWWSSHIITYSTEFRAVYAMHKSSRKSYSQRLGLHLVGRIARRCPASHQSQDVAAEQHLYYAYAAVAELPPELGGRCAHGAL